MLSQMEGRTSSKNKHQYLEYEQMLVQRATCVNIYQYLKIGMNVIAVGKANFVKKQTPISGV